MEMINPATNDYIPYSSIMPVIESWDLARRRHGFDEQLGIDTLVRLLQRDARLKVVFGFPADQDITKKGIQQMGLLIHGLRLVRMLDVAIEFLGPDMDGMDDAIVDLARRHRQLGVLPEHFRLFSETILEVLSKCLRKEWTYDLENAWDDVLNGLSSLIIKAMESQ